MPEKIGKYYYYSGALHVHTTESDGTKTLEEVAALGNEAGLDFLMFTDHMTLSNRDNGKEGFYDKMLVVVGYEHNDLEDIHHYLIFDSPRVYPGEMPAAEYVAAGADDKALGILAHPDEVRDRLPEFPPYPWKDWSTDRFDGMEIWNQMSEWMERLTRFNKIMMAFSPRKSMVAPTDRILAKWDEISMHRKCVGVAGVDAHAFKQKVGPLEVEIFPYKVHFKCLRTHVILPEKLSTDFESAKKQLYDAIRDCRIFFSNMRWGKADKFLFMAENDNETAVSGESINSLDGTKLIVKLPRKATVRLIHNGHKVLETLTDKIEYGVNQPGIYRVEAWLGKRGWIFSNHIRIAH